jgi:hypothetical protein
MKKHRLIALVFALIGACTLVVCFTPSLLMHFLFRQKADVIQSSKDIENALLILKHQQSQTFDPHVIFKISRQAHSAWNWSANWKGARVGHSWTQRDRIIEFAKVGDDMLVYSILIRWQEDESAGQVVSEMETNVSPCMSGNEIYSTSEEEYKRLRDYLMAKTPDMYLRCSISKDATGRVARDIECLGGSLSLPQSEWADFVQRVFKSCYQSEQPIYRERIGL